MTDQAAAQKLAFVKEARQLLALFNDPAWATSAQKDDEAHVIDFADAIVDTREGYPGLPEVTAMSMVLGEGDKILAYTGNTPEAALRAKAIVGFIHSMPACSPRWRLPSPSTSASPNCSTTTAIS